MHGHFIHIMVMIFKKSMDVHVDILWPISCYLDKIMQQWSHISLYLQFIKNGDFNIPESATKALAITVVCRVTLVSYST